AVRHMAMAKLQSMFPIDSAAVLYPAFKQRDNAPLRARALWQIARLVPQKDLDDIGVRLAEDEDDRFRILSLRLLRDWGRKSFADYPDLVFLLPRDPSPAVSREALLALRDYDPAKAKPIIMELAKRYDGKDRFYLEAIGIAVGHHDKARRDVILADFDKQFPRWDEKVADLVWELRPPQMLPLLEKRLADGSLPAGQRARVVDLLAGSPDAAAGTALLKALRADAPGAVRERAVEHLKALLPGKWNGLRRNPQLADTITRLLDRPQTRAAGLELIGAAGKQDA